MKNVPDNTGARDKVRPPEYYRAYIARMEAQLDLEVKGGNPAVFLPVGDYCIRMARAAYSAGAPPVECRDYLKRAADFQIRFFTEGVPSKLSDLHPVFEYFEWFSAAYLVGSAPELIEVFERRKPDRMAAWDRALLDALVSLLLGRAIDPDEEGMALAAKIKEYALLPGLLHAVDARDLPAFSESLQTYATKSWGRLADRWAKDDLSKPYPDYFGKWSFFCAAMCGVMGDMPALSKKALEYVPVELVAQ